MRTKKLALYALLTALAMILSYVESLVPLSFAVPGIKLGLPNIVIVFALYRLGLRPACVISLVRVVLVSILFGNLFSMVYSLAGAALSLCVMGLLKKWDKFSSVGVSVAGGLAHNLGQIIVAMFVLETAGLIYYLPALCVSGTIAGICVGVAGGIVVKRVNV